MPDDQADGPHCDQGRRLPCASQPGDAARDHKSRPARRWREPGHQPKTAQGPPEPSSETGPLSRAGWKLKIALTQSPPEVNQSDLSRLPSAAKSRIGRASASVRSSDGGPGCAQRAAATTRPARSHRATSTRSQHLPRGQRIRVPDAAMPRNRQPSQDRRLDLPSRHLRAPARRRARKPAAVMLQIRSGLRDPGRDHLSFELGERREDVPEQPALGAPNSARADIPSGLQHPPIQTHRRAPRHREVSETADPLPRRRRHRHRPIAHGLRVDSTRVDRSSVLKRPHHRTAPRSKTRPVQTRPLQSPCMSETERLSRLPRVDREPTGRPRWRRHPSSPASSHPTSASSAAISGPSRSNSSGTCSVTTSYTFSGITTP